MRSVCNRFVLLIHEIVICQLSSSKSAVWHTLSTKTQKHSACPPFEARQTCASWTSISNLYVHNYTNIKNASANSENSLAKKAAESQSVSQCQTAVSLSTIYYSFAIGNSSRSFVKYMQQQTKHAIIAYIFIRCTDTQHIYEMRSEILHVYLLLFGIISDLFFFLLSQWWAVLVRALDNNGVCGVRAIAIREDDHLLIIFNYFF